MEKNFSYLLGKKVKAVFRDGEKTKVVIGILNDANSKYIVIDDVFIGLGDSFIFCVPQEGNND